MVPEDSSIRFAGRALCALAGLVSLGIHPASAQQRLGAVVCEGSELETLVISSPLRHVVRWDTESVCRIGADLSDQDEVALGLRAELVESGDIRCIWSEHRQGHVVVVSYAGVVRQDATTDPENPGFQAFGVGDGPNCEKAEQLATTLDDRVTSNSDGTGYKVLARGTANVGLGGAALEGEGPALPLPVHRTEIAAPSLPGLPAEAARARQDTVFRDCATCPEMVVVPAGSFVMGSPESEEGRWNAEGPRHTVRIASPLAVGVYEVTFAEWDACVKAQGCGSYRPGEAGWRRENRPITHVSWEDAQQYVRWLSRETGERYRLPSEAEWEYVARAGTQTARYWGESEWGQCRFANGDADGALCSESYEHTAPVGSFQPNAFGLYDVLGNVWEWTQDCWNQSYLVTRGGAAIPAAFQELEATAGKALNAPNDGSDWRSGDCTRRVLRGGSWDYEPWGLRSAYRNRSPVGSRTDNIGFRVARTMN